MSNWLGGIGGGNNQAVALTVGGVWNMVNNLTNGGGGFYTAADGPTFGPTNSSGATATPLGRRRRGHRHNGTGTFTQTCGTNAFIGGGGVRATLPTLSRRVR